MTDGQTLMMELQGKVSLLDKALQQLGNRGRAAAQAEQDYRVERAKHTLVLRDKGIPATLIQDLCRGEPTIAKLKFEWDVSAVSYDAAKEAINSYKLQIRVLEETIEREYRG